MGRIIKKQDGYITAILLIGPTGSGKTPLGDFLEKSGFAGQRCVHFDFGRNLRRVVGLKARPSFLCAGDFNIVKNVLKSGALLAEDEFHIARDILEDFMRRKKVAPDDILVLNGLPRHVGQAKAIAALVRVKLVINLKCSPAVVVARIRLNAGGDRVGRVDDSLALVRRKLRIFRARTIPLLDHYKAKRVKVINITVARESMPAGIVRELKIRAKIRPGGAGLLQGSEL